MRKNKGIVWTSTLIIYALIVLLAICLWEGVALLNSYLGVEDPVKIEQPINKNFRIKGKIDSSMKLSPKLVTSYRVKSKCCCGFDFEPWKDDKTHRISHGLCVDCYVKTMLEIGIRPKISMVVSGIKRMVNAERWWSV